MIRLYTYLIKLQTSYSSVHGINTYIVYQRASRVVIKGMCICMYIICMYVRMYVYIYQQLQQLHKRLISEVTYCHSASSQPITQCFSFCFSPFLHHSYATKVLIYHSLGITFARQISICTLVQCMRELVGQLVMCICMYVHVYQPLTLCGML